MEVQEVPPLIRNPLMARVFWELRRTVGAGSNTWMQRANSPLTIRVWRCACGAVVGQIRSWA